MTTGSQRSIRSILATCQINISVRLNKRIYDFNALYGAHRSLPKWNISFYDNYAQHLIQYAHLNKQKRAPSIRFLPRQEANQYPRSI